MSKVSDDNYFQVSGWMLNKLNLKGIALEVFAIIYGFSQDGETEFTGSIQYLCDFTGTSRPTVIKALKDLVDQNYLIKNELEINGVKFNKYKANLQVVKDFYRGSKEVLQGDSKNSLQGGSKETLPNNKSIDNELLDNIKYIIEYLNQKAGTHYRYTTSKTQKALKALLTGKQPYTVQECITVIDKKCSDWIGTEWEKYLRPETLFGEKFENYLNAKGNAKPKYSSTPQLVTINGKEYEYRNGKYYDPKGNGIAVDPYAVDDLPF